MAKKRKGAAIDVLAVLIIIALIVWNYRRTHPGPVQPEAVPGGGPSAKPAPTERTEAVPQETAESSVPDHPPPRSGRVTGIALCALDREPIRRGKLLVGRTGGEVAAQAGLDQEGRFFFDWSSSRTRLFLALKDESFEAPDWVEVSLEGRGAAGGPAGVRDLGSVAFEIRGRSSWFDGDAPSEDPSEKGAAGEAQESILLRFETFTSEPGLLDVLWGIPEAQTQVLPGSVRDDLLQLMAEGSVDSSGTVEIAIESGRAGRSLIVDQQAYVQDVGRDSQDPGAAWKPVVGTHNTGMTVLARARARDGGIELERVEGMRSYLLGMYRMAGEVKAGTESIMVRWDEPVTLVCRIGPLSGSVFLEEDEALLLDLAIEPVPRRGTAHIRAHALRIEESFEPRAPDGEALMGRLEHHVLITAER